MKISISTMQKDEGLGLLLWAKYHGSIYGYESLYVYDNGSKDPETIRYLNDISKMGAKVSYDYVTREDFERKGQIIVDEIRYLEKIDKYFDFNFPLDTDEFLSVDLGEGVISCGNEDLFSSIEPFRNEKRVLRIGYALDANPIRKNIYLKSSSQRKSFFSGGTARKLDVGFHEGENKYGKESVRTPIVYIHLHFKNYLETQFRSLQKLRGRVSSFSRRDLIELYDQRYLGWHLVPGVLKSRDEYYASFRTAGSVRSSIFTDKLEALGIIEPFERLMDFEDSDSKPTDKTAMPRAADRGDIRLLRGFIEAIRISGDRLVIRGWAASPDVQAPPQFRVRTGSRYCDITPDRRHRRPDVQAAHPGVEPMSGFELGAPVESLDRTETLRVHPIWSDGAEGRALECRIFGGVPTIEAVEKLPADQGNAES